ncbi:uncharacterized protein PHALS_15090 [Plasmopara halstedii]|uniref:Uncharacterized protein n=1 Tax=Plasmopara halstedii TaxID=4781 RepID=A0A0P1AB00_PLAHL|nr:uncharacterized protein PHALS_15090 [Plasmopara halstedii]CEG37570.1 hypothetical protein PHALS_15090 [Plasmopara halstedii]|eukprot:XP_024573939.1 hypothetical protein PHALS_15090 [Plasmopara halstedii]
MAQRKYNALKPSSAIANGVKGSFIAEYWKAGAVRSRRLQCGEKANSEIASKEDSFTISRLTTHLVNQW